MRYTIVSIEDGIACLENENSEKIFVKTEILPEKIKEGEILDFDGEKYVINQQATAERRSAIYEKFKKILK